MVNSILTVLADPVALREVGLDETVEARRI
jgi:hypothetical protein